MTTSNPPGQPLIAGARDLSPDVRRLISRSPVAHETRFGTDAPAVAGFTDVFWFVQQAADEIPPWGWSPTYRDRMLRAMVTTESTLAGAFGTIIARNAAFDWKVDGPGAAVNRAHDILENANAGKGWLDFIIKFCWDYYCTDKGAFVAIVREADDPRSPCIGIETLDSVMCWHTGNIEEPVVYCDANGKYHRLKWYQVFTAAEMPAPHERLFGMQYSAMTRVLRAATLFRNVQQYLEEKTGGRFNRAINVVSGVQKSELEAAMNNQQSLADARGLKRYITPVVLATLNPQIKPEVATLELAALPDNFDAEEEFKRYLTMLSMGLLTDYQEFAPLPGGGLGTSAQSEILHAKTRGKGPGLFMKMMEHRLNFSGVLPRSVQFSYAEQDIETERTEAEVKKLRAEARKVMIDNGEIDASGARQLALDAGDIPQELFDQMNNGDVTGAERTDTDAAPSRDESPTGDGRTAPTATNARVDRTLDTQAADNEPTQLGTRELRDTPATAMLVEHMLDGLREDVATTIGDFLISRLHKSFTIAADDMRGLGYMTTSERIALSGLIGDVLNHATELFGAEAAETIARNLDAEDQRLLIVSARELNPDLAGPEAERLAIEEALAAPLGRGLVRMRGNVSRYLAASE